MGTLLFITVLRALHLLHITGIILKIHPAVHPSQCVSVMVLSPTQLCTGRLKSCSDTSKSSGMYHVKKLAVEEACSLQPFTRVFVTV